MSPVPHLLLLTGAPASGKTRLAVRLEQHYGACRCSKDEIKELLFDVLGEGDSQWSRQLSNASFALLFAYAPRLLLIQRLLLMEGNFSPGEHEAAVLAVASEGAAQLAQILCQATAATRTSRLAARAIDPARHPAIPPSRHPAHRDRELDAMAAERVGFLDLPGPRWVFDSDAHGDNAWLELCRRIDCCLDAGSGGAGAQTVKG